MKMWWRALSVVGVATAMPTLAPAEQIVSGTWTLETELRDGAYTLASRDAAGQYLICFTSGTVRSVTVAAGAEESQLARGSCTVFAPAAEHGIIVDFATSGASEVAHAVALGTFSVILPGDD